MSLSGVKNVLQSTEDLVISLSYLKVNTVLL